MVGPSLNREFPSPLLNAQAGLTAARKQHLLCIGRASERVTTTTLGRPYGRAAPLEGKQQRESGKEVVHIMSRRKKSSHSERRIRVRAELRSEPDLRRLSRTIVALAMAQAEADAQAEQATVDDEQSTPPPLGPSAAGSAA